jgi:hypothetical protein
MKKRFIGLLILLLSAWVQSAYGAAGDVASINGKAITAVASVAGKANAAILTIGGKPCSDGDGNNTVDMSRGFEIVETERTDTAVWNETDTASLLDDVDSGQAHSGTNSMVVLGNATTEAHQRYDTGETRTDISISVWIYAPASSGGDDSPRLVQFGASSTGTYGMWAGFRKASGAYYFIARGAGDIVAGSKSITANAWYRLEIDYTQNDTSTVKVYNTAGSLLDTVSITATNNASRYLFLGKIGNSTTTWGSFYFDDLGIDYADATTPLSPFTVAD